ncbi:MAG: phasin family protein [Sedimentitalea sp.]
MADDKNSNPFMDMFQNFGSSLNIPGPDLNDMMDYHRKNLQAIQAATQIGTQTSQALMEKQRDTLEKALAGISDMVQNAQSGGGTSEMMSQPMELAKTSFDETIKNAKDIAEIVQQGNTDAFNVLKDRVVESIADLTEGKKS